MVVVGIAIDPITLYNDMKDKNIKELLIFTRLLYSIIILLEIRICNDSGRLTRPVLRVKK